MKMYENSRTKKVWETKITGKRRKARPENKWDKQIQQILEERKISEK